MSLTRQTSCGSHRCPPTPGFLCRQTDLVVALAETGRPVNVKAQFLAAHEMGHIIRKFEEAGTSRFYSVSVEVLLGTTI